MKVSEYVRKHARTRERESQEERDRIRQKKNKRAWKTSNSNHKSMRFAIILTSSYRHARTRERESQEERDRKRQKKNKSAWKTSNSNHKSIRFAISSVNHTNRLTQAQTHRHSREIQNPIPPGLCTVQQFTISLHLHGQNSFVRGRSSVWYASSEKIRDGENARTQGAQHLFQRSLFVSV